MRKQLLAGAAALAMLGQQAGAVPIQWAVADGGNDHWYEFVLASVGQADAMALAAASSWMGMTGYLATSTSAAEQAFLFGVPRFGPMWLGGTDKGTPGSWRWETGPEAGQPIAWTNWGAGEPQPAFAGNGGLWGNNGSVWNSLDRDAYALGYVIEYGGMSPPPPGVPEPASWALLVAGFGLLGASARRRRRAVAA